MVDLRYADIQPRKSFFIEKHVVAISCKKGFRLIGASKLECTKYGNWSHSFPKCIGKKKLVTLKFCLFSGLTVGDGIDCLSIIKRFIVY